MRREPPNFKDANNVHLSVRNSMPMWKYLVCVAHELILQDPKERIIARNVFCLYTILLQQ